MLINKEAVRAIDSPPFQAGVFSRSQVEALIPHLDGHFCKEMLPRPERAVFFTTVQVTLASCLGPTRTHGIYAKRLNGRPIIATFNRARTLAIKPRFSVNRGTAAATVGNCPRHETWYAL